jgi:DNA-binding NtrC family response regulator
VLDVGDAVTVADLGSVNGTMVRGQKLEPNQPVAITVGELVAFGTVSVILQARSRTVRPRTLWTHDHFMARLEEECAREERSGAAFTLIRIQFGTAVPTGFVEETLGELLRDSDILGKYSGHVYELLLPDTPANKAEEAVQRIERKLLERGLRSKAFIACCPRDGRSAAELDAKAQRPRSGEHSTGKAIADIVVADTQMQALYKLVEQIAVSDISVLLLGETGAGKEVFARAIHRCSPRASGPFIELNCAALTEQLLESELFGHEKGAFTNAVAAKPGLLEVAHGGTLFLDEIGDMPLTTQVKLLRAIEDSQLRRVGGLKSRSIDVRFVAATNSDIEVMVARNTFRSDLFFRLNGVTILIPPLRERLGELEPLSRAFIKHAARGNARPSLTPEALAVMRAYAWPGNVRELKHVIERAVLLCQNGSIQAEHVSVKTSRPTPAPPELAPREGATREVPPLARPRKGSDEERAWIMRALEQTNGNQTLAAKMLGISRRTLVNRLSDYSHDQRQKS